MLYSLGNKQTNQPSYGLIAFRGKKEKEISMSSRVLYKSHKWSNS